VATETVTSANEAANTRISTGKNHLFWCEGSFLAVCNHVNADCIGYEFGTKRQNTPARVEENICFCQVCDESIDSKQLLLAWLVIIVVCFHVNSTQAPTARKSFI